MKLPTIAEINEARAELKSKFNSDMNDLASLEALVSRLGAPASNVVPNSPRQEIIDFGSVPNAVKYAIARLPEQFTSVDVVAKINESCPGYLDGKSKSGVSSALILMEQRKDIELVERGAGKRATIYKKISR